MTAYTGLNKVSINRTAKGRICKFSDVFVGFEKVKAVQSIFGRNTAKVLGRLEVRLSNKPWFMWINDDHGCLMIYRKYLKTGKKLDLYLDVVHELVHIRQHREGKELFDENYAYVDRPTEIEAYRTAVKEAKRLGMSKIAIKKYLDMGRWISKEEYMRLHKHCGL